MKLSIQNQLESFFVRPNFCNLLQHRFRREHRVAGNFEDIYDGDVYREHSYFTNDPNNLTFTLYSDGVSIYKSSKFSIWPLMLAINELPYAERIKKENMVLAGLWFGKDKPKGNLFLLPFHEEFTRLYSGVSLKSAVHANPIIVRCLVLCSTFDMDAKALFCNIQKWSGFYACLKCETKGEKSQRTQNVMVFPYDRAAQPRTKESFSQSATEALRTGKAVKGVKGPSVLQVLLPNVITAVVIDPMHCLFQGVVKRLMTLWFSSEFRDSAFSLYAVIAVVTQRLLKLTPASYVQRLPRSIDDLAYWKASEVRNWFFFYSAPILSDVMLPQFFQHYLLLVWAVFLLEQDSVSPENIDLAGVLLDQFVASFEELYGVRHMSLNVHSLLHLPQCVRDFGPLWVYSCFPFESVNGLLTKLVHGTRYAHVQLTSMINLHINLSTMIKDLPPNEIREFCDKLLKKGHARKFSGIDESSFAVGKIEMLDFVPQLIQRALAANGVRYRNVHIFKKFLRNGQLFFSRMYTRKVKTNSTFVLYGLQDNLGIISSFVRVTMCGCDKLCNCQSSTFAVVEKLEKRTCFSTANPHTAVSFIQLCVLTEDVEAVALHELRTLCFAVLVENKLYVVRPPNELERE